LVALRPTQDCRCLWVLPWQESCRCLLCVFQVLHPQRKPIAFRSDTARSDLWGRWINPDLLESKQWWRVIDDLLRRNILCPADATSLSEYEPKVGVPRLWLTPNICCLGKRLENSEKYHGITVDAALKSFKVFTLSRIYCLRRPSTGKRYILRLRKHWLVPDPGRIVAVLTNYAQIDSKSTFHYAIPAEES
jgi:hypothetical protein